MAKVRLVVWLATLLLSITAFLPATTVAHDAGTFTVLIKSDQITPNQPEIVFNDSVWWYNVDDTENITHRIVYDSDGDGLYNGTLDWDSGNLSYECEKDEYGNLTNPDCKITYEIPFNGSWGAGTYNYQDILSNGVVNNGTIIVLPDYHGSEENSPPIGGYQFGVDEPEETLDLQDDGTNPRDWLLWVAAGSGLIALLLIGLLLMGSFAEVSEEEEESELNNDSDIVDIAEEE
mgnify:FL=1